ncbi:uncharacterized protein LOC124938419 [Impatiens glandulifera]|uniref:uncharacterized protein LOC124938419 n=1 Tax=Impatiens glandulifera TaxID=253017 RepID=UPI001FB12FF2|nr:uncharacterized protein LOC124938419 [Impatiens glandulifera]
MENSKGSERRSLGKRKPFFDTTNLIPAAATKLSSTLSEKPQFLSPIRDTPVQSSLLTSETSKTSTSKVDSNSSTSNASIRASNFRTPSRTHRSTPTGKVNGATNEKLIVYSTRGTTAKRKNGATDLFGFSPVLRTQDLATDLKGKGKAKAAPDNFPTMQKMKGKENVTALNLEKSKGLRRDKEDVTVLPHIRPPLKKLMTTNTYDLTEEDVILLENVKTKRKAISTAYSSSADKPIINKFRDNLNKSEDTSPVKSHTERKKKRQWSSMQQTDSVTPEYDLQKEYIEKQRAYFKEVDEFELPVEEVSARDSD